MPRQPLSPLPTSGVRAGSCTWLCCGAFLSRVKVEGSGLWGSAFDGLSGDAEASGFCLSKIAYFGAVLSWLSRVMRLSAGS